MDRSEGKSPAAAGRRRVLPETERKRPGGAANSNVTMLLTGNVFFLTKTFMKEGMQTYGKSS